MPGIIVDAYEESKCKKVMQDTWGHLEPKIRNKYFGWIIVAVGVYDEIIIVDHCFPGLDNSPWQYDDFQKFIRNKLLDFDPGVYKLKGWYMKYKNGNYHIGGKFIRLC